MTLKRRIQSIEKKAISGDSKVPVIEIGGAQPDGSFVPGCRYVLNEETGKYDYFPVEEVAKNES